MVDGRSVVDVEARFAPPMMLVDGEKARVAPALLAVEAAAKTMQEFRCFISTMTLN